MVLMKSKPGNHSAAAADSVARRSSPLSRHGIFGKVGCRTSCVAAGILPHDAPICVPLRLLPNILLRELTRIYIYHEQPTAENHSFRTTRLNLNAAMLLRCLLLTGEMWLNNAS
jgi:hypothetical protein